MRDDKVFLRFLAFTVPQVTVFAGAVFGVALVTLDTRRALGVFALTYGLGLLLTALPVRGRFSTGLYRAYLLFSVLLVLAGVAILSG